MSCAGGGERPGSQLDPIRGLVEHGVFAHEIGEEGGAGGSFEAGSGANRDRAIRLGPPGGLAAAIQRVRTEDDELLEQLSR